MALTPEQESALKAIHGEGAVPAPPVVEPTGNTPPPTSEAPTTEDNPAPPVPKEDKDVVPPTVELDETAVLAYLNKQGIKAASLKELAPKEDPTVLAEKKEAEVLAYGLQNGKFTKKEYDNYQRDTADLQNLVYKDFYEDAKKGDPELTDEDIQAEFLSKYGLDGEKDSRKYKRGIQEMAVMADKIIKSKYGKIFSVESEFDNKIQSEAARLDYEKRILQAAPAYKKDIEDIFGSLQKVPFKIGEDVFEVDADAEAIEAIKNDFLSKERLESNINGSFSKDDLKQMAEMALFYQNKDKYFEKAAIQYLHKHQAGTKGIVPQGGIKQPEEKQLTENQRKALQFTHGPNAIAN